MKSRVIQRVTAALFIYSLLLLGIVPAQTFAVTKQSVTELEAKLQKLEKRVESRRKELGIPGIAMAVVKDGKVVLSKGYGYKNFEKKIAMTPDTQLAIGSATKAFTGLSAVMMQDKGKISLDDSPIKYLPYFKMFDPDTEKNMQVRDLMIHSSGLNRTDLAMITGKLNRVELIRVAGDAKPMAGLRKRFFYQNIMFAAAGEVVAKAYGNSWEEFVPKEIFKPLGMNNSTMTTKQFKKVADYSYGYSYNFDTKKTTRLPKRDISHVAPAGSINSSANDMTRWLRFILDEGMVNGKRLISKEAFDEWTKGHMNVAPNGSVKYALGWFVQDWNKKRVIHHGGNIDGFSSMVALMPEEKLGVVLLTNVSGSSLQNEIRSMVWEELVGDSRAQKAGPEQEREVGLYAFPQAGFDITVEIENGQLVAKVPGQPTYKLVKEKGRRYSLANAPSGFFITFKDTEAYLEQPQGNFTLKKKGVVSDDKPETVEKDETLSKLKGDYVAKISEAATAKIVEKDGAISLVVGGQPPYPLKRVEKDKYGSSSLPETYYLVVNRSEDGSIKGFTMNQPEGAFEFLRAKKASDLPSASELIAKVIEAGGGLDAMMAIENRRTEYEMNAVHQGVKGKGKQIHAAPNMSRSEPSYTPSAKILVGRREVFNGKNGYEDYSFAEREDFTGKRLVDVTFGMDFRPFIDYDKKGVEAKVLRKAKIRGKDVFVLGMTPKGGSRVMYFIDQNDYTVHQKTSQVVSSTSSVTQPVTERYDDYRKVDGIFLPFKITVTNPSMGDIITTVTKVEHNIKLKKNEFKAK